MGVSSSLPNDPPTEMARTPRTPLLAAPLAECDPEVLDDLRKRMLEYDYIRYTYTDLNGAQRGITVPARAAQNSIERGVQVVEVLLVFGPNNEVPITSSLQKQKWGNAILLPDPVTLHLVPWAGHGEYQVAEVLCESYWIQDRAPQLACPRFVCRQQLARLKAEGFEFKCGFEIEFRLEDSKTGNPVFPGSAMFNHTMVALQEKLLFDADKHFAKLNINANKIHSEFTPGQYEFTFLPSVGIRGADDPFITKFGLKEMATRIGLNANFMTKPELELFDTSMQFNHSLVSLDGSNAFYDGSAGDNLSDVMRYWIAGLLQHARALKAFCCPSVNCYRRSPSQYAPHKADWGCEDRLCCLRVRNQDEAMTFIENRLCTGLCNPYLVVAAHIAAGLDGISRRLKCPPTAFSDAPVLPSTLSEALVALEEDTLLVEALGREVVDWFVQFKRQVDLTKLKEGNDVMGDPASLQAERDMYAYHL